MQFNRVCEKCIRWQGMEFCKGVYYHLLCLFCSFFLLMCSEPIIILKGTFTKQCFHSVVRTFLPDKDFARVCTITYFICKLQSRMDLNCSEQTFTQEKSKYVEYRVGFGTVVIIEQHFTQGKSKYVACYVIGKLQQHKLELFGHIWLWGVMQGSIVPPVLFTKQAMGGAIMRNIIKTDDGS